MELKVNQLINVPKNNFSNFERDNLLVISQNPLKGEVIILDFHKNKTSKGTPTSIKRRSDIAKLARK